ncbi:gluconate 5-dehydrogenase [Hoeflea marina]|uniref:Gluconate 5-dehydrogenase n=1 Tax=Hoeflea marina TaxID=274592 RepID=A0A317PLT6_9HYPH|nr:SDR family oxidoreductase [Hoeflea marina]PWW00007.1 gluconate 5-dehydrogenase [Hoeflea marina]
MALVFDLSGRTACVTGASSGLGRVAANALAAAGARVVGVARRQSELDDWRREAGGETASVAADLADRGRFDATIEAIIAPFGAPDILVSAAGINTRQPADEVTPANWDLTLDLNLRVPFFLAQAFAPVMKQRQWGRIVNFASLQSRRAFASGIAYGASKGGVEQMTRAMAEAWSKDGINANALAPGFFPTELTKAVFADAARVDALARQTCIGRNGRPEDLVGPLLFLCSDASAYVTGQVLFVDGGFTAK